MIELFSEIKFSTDALKLLDSILILIKHLMTLLGSLVILIGSGFVICQFIYHSMYSRYYRTVDFDFVRLGLTRSILLGLEFIIAADVIQTTTTPDYYAVGILASLAVIRAFLSYFLNKDLGELTQRKQKNS